MDKARVILPPLVTAYAIFVVMVVRSWRLPTKTPPQARRSALREAVVTLVGGYLVFLLIVAVFHVGLAGQRGAFRSAALGGGFLLIGATAVFAACLWIMARIGRAPSRSEGGRADEGDGLENR